MKNPWTDGPRELLQHAVDHLSQGNDFDRRIAMISIDNSVELIIKTYLGLPKRALDHSGPSRKELGQASESFPALLDLLEKYAGHKIVGLGLDDLEWYHRIRNQLYHSGNGITVEKSKVETYFEFASTLFESLFGSPPEISHLSSVRTKTGEFLENWVQFEKKLRSQLPEKKGPAYYWKRDYLKAIHPDVVELFNAVTMFRNELVHGHIEPGFSELEEQTENIKRLIKYIIQVNAEQGH